MQFSTSLRRGLILLALLLVILFAAFLWQRPLLNIGAGYAAKHACSCHYLQGRELEEIREHDLNFSVLGSVSLSLGKQSVRASFFGLAQREAFFQPGIGCTLLNNTEQKLKAFKGVAAGAKKRQKAVVKKDDRLTKALDFGMSPVPGGGARGLVIMQSGVIIGERYAEGYDQDTPLLGWSMTKTLTAMAYGATLPLDSTLDITAEINRKNLFPEWAADSRKNITVGHLLNMNSGLAWNEAYGAISDATVMLHEQPNMAAYAEGMPAEFAPGDDWKYSSGTTNIIMDLTDRNIRQTASLESLLNRLYGKVAPSLLIEPDQSGRPVGSSYGWATARDWANLGQFMLQDGIWAGDTLLPSGWIDWMRQPAAGSEGTYGGQTWLPGPDMPSLPQDAFMMRGFQDQRVFIIPSRQLVIARLGHGEDQVTDFDGLVERVLAIVD
ncbi:MAG: serine hydrolase [Bacteroidota bacterium]